ncbi:hypothetical protein KR100_10530 [Synechococcus sp. KORDI-100]|nr:hypothetical protein KR100_10530 [Synechococcus sp. KORDI-100]
MNGVSVVVDQDRQVSLIGSSKVDDQSVSSVAILCCMPETFV